MVNLNVPYRSYEEVNHFLIRLIHLSDFFYFIQLINTSFFLFYPHLFLFIQIFCLNAINFQFTMVEI